MKHSASLVLSTGLTLALASAASAELRYENNSGGYTLIYGQFSPAYQSFDDGISSTNTFVDNVHSNSRVGLKLVQPFTQGTFSFNFETALGLRPSDGVSQLSTPQGASWDRTRIRKVDFAFASNTWGMVYAGQGSMATDGVAENAFGSNGMTTYNGIGDGAGSFQFRTAAGALSGITIADVTPSFDGSRRGRVRYDTPSFSGFTLAVAAGTDVLNSNNDDEFYDAALKYAGEFGGVEVKAGVGFSRRDRNGVKRDDTFGSIAAKLPSGINFAVAAGRRKNDGKYAYGQIGYERSFFPVGDTSFAIDYYDGKDFNTPGSSSKSLGVGVNQNFDSINTQVYLGYRSYEFSEVAASYLDAESILFGARWKF